MREASFRKQAEGSREKRGVSEGDVVGHLPLLMSSSLELGQQTPGDEAHGRPGITRDEEWVRGAGRVAPPLM